MKADYEVNWHHRVICDALDRIAGGHSQRLAIFVPPQHGKSELASRHYPAYALGVNPNHKVLHVTYNDDFAKDFNRDVQRIIDRNRYRDVFPNTRLYDQYVRSQATGQYLRNSDTFEIVNYSGFYKSAGVGGGISGKPADLAIIDDPIKGHEQAYSAVQRRKLQKWYSSELLTRLHNDSSVLLIQTRWHREDLAGYVLNLAEKDPHADKWEVICFKAIRDAETIAVDHRREGEPLWPKRHSLESLLAKRASDPIEFESLYQQNPRPEGATEFHPEWFGPHAWFDEWPKDWLCKVIALDPSKGKDAKKGDYGAFVLAMVTRDLKMYVDAQIGRWNTDTLAEMAVELSSTFGPDRLGCEALQFQELLCDNISRVASKRGILIHPHKITDNTKKFIRIRRLTEALSKGEIRFKADSPGTLLLVEQLQDFPHGAHDDGPDALEMAFTMCKDLLAFPGEPPPEIVY